MIKPLLTKIASNGDRGAVVPFGSYTAIMTYLTDMPCDDDTWFPLRRMEGCDSCQACVKACPTGAIDTERRLIDSDRCITYFSDSTGKPEYPEWFDVKLLNSIAGCTACQDCCPANAMNKDNVIVSDAFTEDETNELLHSTEYSETLKAKIESADLDLDFTEYFAEKLSAFLQK